MKAILPSILIFATCACNSQKQNDKIRTLDSHVKQLKTELVEWKQKAKAPKHHYELRSEGFRTFRFDPATGDTCIEFTTPADWKRKETKSQSCACVDEGSDWLEMASDTEEERRMAQSYYEYFVEPTCGN